MTRKALYAAFHVNGLARENCLFNGLELALEGRQNKVSVVKIAVADKLSAQPHFQGPSATLGLLRKGVFGGKSTHV